MIMPWGKYRGKRLEQIPVSYLGWVYSNCTNVSPQLRQEIRRVLADELESQGRQQDALSAPNLVSRWYRQLATEFHPDKRAGNHQAMVAINRGRDLLLRLLEESVA